MQELTLKEIQSEQLAILKKVDAICRRIGVKYWLLFGTLLGAVRHKGFIPWDDDIDIGMMHDDFNKLIKYMSSGAADENDLHLDTVKTRENYVCYIARVSETKNVITSGEIYKTGVFIDIYPMDIVTEKWRDSWQRLFAINMHNFSDTVKSFRGLNRRTKIVAYSAAISARAIRTAVSCFSKKASWLVYYWFAERIAGMCMSDKGEYVCITCWEPKSIWRKECFAETLTVKFEDFDAPIPAGYDEVLRVSYGDYMTPPPKDQQKPHKIYTVCRP